MWHFLKVLEVWKPFGGLETLCKSQTIFFSKPIWQNSILQTQSQKGQTQSQKGQSQTQKGFANPIPNSKGFSKVKPNPPKVCKPKPTILLTKEDCKMQNKSLQMFCKPFRSVYRLMCSEMSSF